MVAPTQQSVCVLGSGAAGLITAYTLIQDGFENVTILTRDATPGGVWAAERVYPGLLINNVHGEYRFSPLPMPPPPHANETGGRLTGEDLRDYFQLFADRFLKGKIQYRIEVTRVRRDCTSASPRWYVTVRDVRGTETREICFDKLVLCTGGCSEPKLPPNLEPEAAAKVGFTGPVLHSNSIAPNQDVLLSAVKPLTGSEPGHVLVIGGGKSAQDAASYFARGGRNVTMVFEAADSILASPVPLPGFLRKSRFLAVMSPSISLKTRLERFLHTTWLGSKITHAVWSFLTWSANFSLNIPPSSPLRSTRSLFWGVRTNDEGAGGSDRFHALVHAGKIKLLAPARAERYLAPAEGASGETVVVQTSDGQRISANAVILATGYKSSWTKLFDESTRKELGLVPVVVPESHEEFNYASFANPPTSPRHRTGAKHSLIYRGHVPAQNLLQRDFAVNGATFTTNPGYAFEVSAHWISSYFLEDTFLRLPRTVGEAESECLRYNAWLRKRYPLMLGEINESYSSALAFWEWPQMVDELMDDMTLPGMRSGGNWLTWLFKVVDLKEIEKLHEERAARRALL
ncbi:FAD/NAD-P-binding domain-containing protein [Cristinia sonorae]|uniref:FAD/NAD-P-binding domain-containing protein n=1 Tax=Cristinia sonorae TaxID=1940300 RepID=A0A8K0UIJ4_9AGAR|nr:FAD/NAD-P-binding domain-containing protein [Cristinia sonorae]